jgi:hypothetical protein
MRYALLIVMILLCTNFVKAQDGLTTFGIKAGIILPSLYGSDIDSLSKNGYRASKLGITLSVFANSRISKHFWLKHELSYSGRFLSIQLADSSSSYKTTYGRSYIDIFPISPTFHFKGFQVYAGPYMGILMQAWINRKDGNGNLYKDKSIFGSGTEFGKQHQKFDAGIVAGLEYEFNFGLNVGFKYVRGFIPVIEYANANTFNDSHSTVSIYNSYVSFTVGYSFIKNNKLKRNTN